MTSANPQRPHLAPVRAIILSLEHEVRDQLEGMGLDDRLRHEVSKTIRRAVARRKFGAVARLLRRRILDLSMDQYDIIWDITLESIKAACELRTSERLAVAVA